MVNVVRYEKTRKGIDEISRRRDLAGKLRVMLILVDPSKTAEQLLAQAAQLGAPADCLERMAREGYIAPVGAVAAAGRQ